jgi:ATP-dependent Clp protease protease subunit
MRKNAQEKPQTMEDRWYEQAIATLADEAEQHRAETARIRYELTELRNWARSRRTYDFAAEVTEQSAYELIAELSDWGAESRDRILLRLFTPGGDEVSGLAIYDFVLALRAEGVPVDTLALGWAASMGSVLLQAGERRYVSPNASVLIHESRTLIAESSTWAEKITDAADRLRWEQDLERRMDAILARRSVFTVRELRAKYARKDWWLTARECVELGFADELWRPKRRRRRTR